MIRNYVSINGDVLHTEEVSEYLNSRPTENKIRILAIANGLEPEQIHTEVILLS